MVKTSRWAANLYTHTIFFSKSAIVRPTLSFFAIKVHGAACYHCEMAHHDHFGANKLTKDNSRLCISFSTLTQISYTSEHWSLHRQGLVVLNLHWAPYGNECHFHLLKVLARIHPHTRKSIGLSCVRTILSTYYLPLIRKQNLTNTNGLLIYPKILALRYRWVATLPNLAVPLEWW